MLVFTGLFNLKTSDYQRELTSIEALKLTPANNANTADFKNIYYWFLKSSLTAKPNDVLNASMAFDNAIANPTTAIDTYLLRAAFNLKWHRLAAAKSDIEQLSQLQNDPKVEVLVADIAMQEGDYLNALNRYQQLTEKNKNWDNLARLAYLQAKLGDSQTAEQLYEAAETEISAKEMRHFAWLELQRGYLALNTGDYQRAWMHYQQADRAYSGYWLSQDYIAEWFATQRDFNAAIAHYRALIACSKHPEHYHALGDLYVYMGKPELAKPWHDLALAAYLASVQRGEVQYYHQLTSFYADTRLDAEKAIAFAQKDLHLRKNVGTRDALAWALFRAGRYAEASKEIQPALAYQWQDAHLFFHAAMIFLAVGQTEQGQAYLQKAAASNPHYTDFHAHR